MANSKEYADSDLAREETAPEQQVVGPDSRSSYDSPTDLYAEEANSFIGGSEVVSRSASRRRRSSRYSSAEVSLYDEDSDLAGETESADSSPIETEEVTEAVDEKPPHKIFTFSLPFGGKNLLPVSPLSSIKAFLSSDQVIDEPDDGQGTEDKLHKQLNREQIKLKLKRQESITSLEERVLFANNKGIENVRSKALKHAFKPDMLINAIKSFSTTDQDEMTDDGYSVSRLESIWDDLEGDIVILGGYRGSILRSTETGKRVWIPIKAGFNIRRINLLLGPSDDDELHATDTIVPGGMLTHLGPVDIAKKLIKRLGLNANVNIQDFGYDWRLSLDITAMQLKEKLQELYDKQTVKKGTYVIAHSMGGLLAHKVLQDHTHLIRGVIYVGAPSQCPNILGPLRFGDEVILNKSILNAETNFFMRSSFYFLPIDGRCFINKDTFKRYDLNYFDPHVWKKYSLSPLVSEEREKLSANDNIKSVLKQTILSPVKMIRKSSNILKDDPEIDSSRSFEECYDYLKRILPRTKRFMDSLEYNPDKEYPPLAIVYGDRVPTVRGAKVKNREEIKKGLYQEFYYGPGDGVVHHKWLLPENRGFPVVAKVASEMPHVSLMTDFEALAKAFISIVDAERSHDTDSVEKLNTV